MLKKDSAYCIVVTTTDEESNASNIASHLISQKLVACVQMDKIKSYYHWQTELKVDDEYRLFIKAPAKNYSIIEQAILRMHNYSLPQIIMLDIADGLDGYLEWLDSSCAK